MFKIKNKKLLMLSAAAAIVLPVTMVLAASTNVNATAHFRAGITLTPTAMDFSNVDYAAAPTGSDNVQLGTDGSIAYHGTFTAGAGAAAHAGKVVVNTGTIGESVTVTCDATAIMGDGAGNTIGVDAIEISTTAGVFGTGSACAGATPALTPTLAGSDQFFIGGEIIGPVTGTFNGGAFSTATGGNDIQVDIVYN